VPADGPAPRDGASAERRAARQRAAAAEQLALFATEPHPVVLALRALDPDELTPRQALALLAELKASVEA
jgi:hypothetical protein